MTTFIRLLDVPVDAKAALLLEIVRERGNGRVFTREPGAFRNVPGSPLGYWVSDAVRSLFRSLGALAGQGRVAASGGKTLDDFRWIRATWEVEPNNLAWVGFAKGGAFSPYYSDVHLFLNWRDNARALKEYLVNYRTVRGWSPHWAAELHGSDHYFRPGLTWPRRTQGGLGLRVMPCGCIFADKGPAAFVEGDRPAPLLALLAITTSSSFRYLVELQMAFGSYEVGVIQRTTVPNLSDDDTKILAALARRAWSLKRSLDTTNETSHAFVLPPRFNEQVTGLDPVAIEKELASIQREIDDRAFDLYGITAEDRATIESAGKPSVSPGEPTENPTDDADEPNEDEEENSTGPAMDALLSWTVGVAFGRFDIRLATGERALPPEPDPFDPLPACSPGMLQGDNGLPLREAPPGYPLPIADGVLVDDPGHPDDLAARCRKVVEIVAKNQAEAWIDEAAAELGQDLRTWLRKTFFENHIKRYSKSRRKAPIFWQLSTPSGSYSLWLDYHRLSRNTFYRLQSDWLAPKLLHEEQRLAALRTDAGASPTATERKAITAQVQFVDELRALRDEIALVAPLWNPNHDDGVILNFAPLHRLVPQHRAWQKECQMAWDKLEAGEYDWAHVAMHLWPERVVPKCKADRSLAIAHGLEAVFWEEAEGGKWKARPVLKDEVDALVAARTSTAVKAALAGLVGPAGSGEKNAVGKGRRGATRGKAG